MSTCPIPGCTHARRPGELLCPQHWRPVPTEMKCAVWNTWRAFTKARDPAAQRLARKPYLEARDAAIAFITKSESLLCA